ncbi:zinc finger protein [Saccharopolyspora taberi]|uniref:Zinc finger protein n=1 Tax=Saccharopolyspora taberi TaxID=60895 RepID=A0ABN3V268_9PSEU
MTHPFRWAPAANERHASRDTAPAGGLYPNGECVETLCGRELSVDNSDIAWLWPTCPDCNQVAHRIAGCPMPPAKKPLLR